MGNNRTKLELTWIGKETRPRLEPRILLKDREKCYHAAHRVTDLFGAQPCSKATEGLIDLAKFGGGSAPESP